MTTKFKKLKVTKPKYEDRKPINENVFEKVTMMDIVYSLHPRQKRLSFFEWLGRYI